MADPPGDSPPPTPAWVKAMAIIALLAFLVVVVLVLAGGHTPPVQHGP